MTSQAGEPLNVANNRNQPNGTINERICNIETDIIIPTVAYAPIAPANIQNTRRHNIGAMKERIWKIERKRFHSPFSFRWRLIRTR
jgi:hypothetical protein